MEGQGGYNSYDSYFPGGLSPGLIAAWQYDEQAADQQEQALLDAILGDAERLLADHRAYENTRHQYHVQLAHDHSHSVNNDRVHDNDADEYASEDDADDEEDYEPPTKRYRYENNYDTDRYGRYIYSSRNTPY